MAKAMVSRSISNHSVILVRVAAGGVGKAVEAKVVVRAAVAAAKVVVAVSLAETNKDVLESGTSAVRGSQARMAGLPRLTKLQGLSLNRTPQPAS
jgi:hypothetical protein